MDFLPEDYPDFIEFGTAPCAESDPDAFFSDETLDGALAVRPLYSNERAAKMVCMSCPYQARCLTYALENPDLGGIWGGTNERQRNAMRRGQIVSLGIPPSRNR
jgi:WhiB family redox-sensing transcriptional regulator